MIIATNQTGECKLPAIKSPVVGLLADPLVRRDDRWFLVQARNEKIARDALQSPYRGCTVYLPLQLVRISHAGRRSDVERAFLPRYLFVLDQEQGTRVINGAPGVSHIVRNGLGVVMVPQFVINAIRAREIEVLGPDGKVGRYVDLDQRVFDQKHETYQLGETVRVSDGPFASFNGIFDRDMRAERRALVLVDIFGRQTPVELEYGQFEKI